MKKSILFVMMFVGVTAGIFAQADLTGKVDVVAQIRNAFDNDTDVEYAVSGRDTEINLKASVDEFSNLTVEFRDNAVGDSASTLTADTVFIESDVAGAFQMAPTDGTGFVFKVKGGLFGLDPVEKGEIVEYSNYSDVIDFADEAAGAAALITLGYTEWLNVGGGFRFADNDNTLSFLANVHGGGAVGPGDLGYTVYTAGDHNSAATTDATDLQVGFGLEYKNLSFGEMTMGEATVPIVTLGFGTQFEYDLESYDSRNSNDAGEANGGAFDGNVQWVYGLNIHFDFIGILDLVIDLTGAGNGDAPSGTANADNFVDALGIGLQIEDPSSIFGLRLTFGVGFGDGAIGPSAGNVRGDVLPDGTRDSGTTEEFAIRPELILRAGAVEFSSGVDVDIDTSENTTIDFQVVLGF